MPIIKTYYKVHRVFPDPDYFYMENTSGSTATFGVEKNGTTASTDLSYSLDKVTWTDIHTGGSIQNVADGAKVYFRSSTGFSSGTANRYSFGSTGSFKAGGHIATLLNYTNPSSVTSIPDYSFTRLFYYYNGFSTITNADIDFYGISFLGYIRVPSPFR